VLRGARVLAEKMAPRTPEGVKGFPDPVERHNAPVRPEFDTEPLSSMRTTEPFSAPLAGLELAPPDGALSRALTQGLDLPLLALRASMESLSQELGDLRARQMDGVLREVELLGKNVRELCAFASPPVPRPLRCTLEEIVCAARAALAPELRARVILVRGERGAALDVDGPLLSGCLRRLLENALEASGEHVLVVASLQGAEASFAVIDDAERGLTPGWTPAPFRTTKPNHLGLGLALVQRDVALLNGRLEFLRSPSGETCVRIAVPLAVQTHPSIPSMEKNR